MWDRGLAQYKKIIISDKNKVSEYYFYVTGDFIITSYHLLYFDDLKHTSYIPHLFNNQLLDCSSMVFTLLLVAFWQGVKVAYDTGEQWSSEYVWICKHSWVSFCLRNWGGGLGGINWSWQTQRPFLQPFSTCSPCMQSRSFFRLVVKIIVKKHFAFNTFIIKRVYCTYIF